tara:strand:- start:2918 stop:4150 length:1233 start_codon:yes stop_codon:yes gene_type:complete
MKSLQNYILASLLLTNVCAFSQSNKVLSGPFCTYVDSYGTQIWFLLDSSATNIHLDIRDYNNDNLLEYNFDVVNVHDLNEFPFKIILDDLVSNMEYLISVFVDDVFVKEIDLFTSRPHLDDIQFLLGSNMGFSNGIFKHMTNTKSDFMVWLGGYTSFSSSTSIDNMIDNYINIRKKTDLNDFMTSTPQIATWGVSDCGFSSTSNFSLKDSAHFVFDLFWPNSLKKTYNYTYFDYGAYQKFNYNDVDLFLLDSRTFITDTTLYGHKQIDRLFQDIKTTNSSFKIIASPVPFTFSSDDSFLNYQDEFNYFLNKLSIAQIDGLILVSSSFNNNIDLGEDVNMNEPLTKMNIYDFTNHTNGGTQLISEFNFPSISDNSYSLIKISGQRNNRILTFESYNENGNVTYRKNLDTDN